jgi:hypothetical protein
VVPLVVNGALGPFLLRANEVIDQVPDVCLHAGPMTVAPRP